MEELLVIAKNFSELFWGKIRNALRLLLNSRESENN